MKWDYRFDAVVLVACNRAKGVWCNESRSLNLRTSRHGGRLNSSATAHSLLVLALISSLRAYSTKQLADMTSRSGRVKPAILVKTLDQSFADALSCFLQGQNHDVLRAGKQLKEHLQRLSSRFVVTVECDPYNNGIRSLGQNMTKAVMDPMDVQCESPTLVPAVITMLGNTFEDGSHVRF